MFSRFVIVAMALIVCPVSAQTTELTVNGGFETGDFTGWSLFPSAPGNITIQAPGFNSAFAGCIDNMVLASSSLIKNANIGVGTVIPGGTVTISFDARGATAVGGVVFAEFFSEIAGGGTSASEILGGGPLALDPDPNAWKSFSFTTTTGSDVSGGVTLQLAAITGAAAGSTSTVCFDNVSVNVPAPSATYPGSGEDVALATGVNAAPDMVDVKTAAGGDFLSVNVSSPSSTFDLSPFILLVQAIPTSGGVGNLGSSGFPEVYLTAGSPFTIIIDPALPGPIGGSVIGPGSGTTLYFSLPPSLNGLGQSLVFQSFVLSGTAANGIFAASDAHEIIVP